MDEGVVGAVLLVVLAALLCWTRYRRGEEGRRVRVKLADGGRPRTGELLRSGARGV